MSRITANCPFNRVVLLGYFALVAGGSASSQPFYFNKMNKQLLPSLTIAFLVCALSIQQANAQYNPLYGNSKGAGSNMQIHVASPGIDDPYIHMFGNDNGDYNVSGSINFVSGYNSNQQGTAFSFALRTAPSGGYPKALQIFQDGRTLVGQRQPSTQTDYKLAVDGKVVAQSLYITQPGSWADFVFAPSYKLMSLSKLDAYLKLNGHLPAIPAASEVELGGYNLTEMDAKLLQSVEELTLHVIKLGKQNAYMQTELRKMRARLNASKPKGNKVGNQLYK